MTILHSTIKKFIFFLGLGFCIFLEAYNGTWVGTTTDWNTASNWTPGGGPPVIPDDQAALPSSSSNYTVSISSDVTIASLTIDSNAPNGYTIQRIGFAGLYFDTTTPPATILTQGTGVHSIVSPIVINNPLEITVDQTPDPTDSSKNFTITGFISENPAVSGKTITKLGSGTLALGGDNSYTGDTFLQEGYLALTLESSTAKALGPTGELQISSGTTLILDSFQDWINATSIPNAIILLGNADIHAIYSPLATPTLPGQISLGGNVIIDVDHDTTLTLTGKITGTSSLTKNGTGILTLSSGVSDYSGGTLHTNGTINVETSQALGTNTVTLSNNTTLNLANGINVANDLIFSSSANINTDIGSASLSGTISGAGPLIKTGVATLSFPTTLQVQSLSMQGGILDLTAPSIFNDPTFPINLTVTSGIVQCNTHNQSITTLLGTGGTIALGGANFFISSGGSYSGIITGATGALHLTGDTLTLSNQNTYGSTVVVGSGTFLTNAAILKAATNETLATNSSLSLADTSTFNLQNYSQTIGEITGSSGTQITFNSGSLTISGGGTHAGSITGTGTLTVSGGALHFSGPTSYTGNTQITNGSLTLTGANTGLSSNINIASTTALNTDAIVSFSSPISGSGTFHLLTNSATLTGSNTGLGSNIVILENGTNLIVNTPSTATIGQINGPGGTLTKNGASNLVLTSSNSYTQGTNLNSGTITISNNSGLGTGTLVMQNLSTLTLNGNLTTTNAVTINGTSNIAVPASFVATLGGVVSGVSGILNKTDDGTLQLTLANTYGGGTQISGGILSISQDNQLGSSLVTLSYGTLQYRSSLTSNLDLTLTGNAGIDVTNGNTVTLSQSINASAIGNLTKTGAGTLILNTANAQKSTTVSGGILEVSQDAALGNGSLNIGSASLSTTADIFSSKNIAFTGNAIINTNGNTDTFTGNTSGAGSLSLQGGGVLKLLPITSSTSFTGATTINSPSTLYMNTYTSMGNINLSGGGSKLYFSQDFSGTYGGVLSGNGSITKEGNGKVSLTQSSPSFTGSFNVLDGELNVNGSILNTSLLTISTQGKLSGSGTVGTTTSSGTISPGNSVGTITINGDLNLTPTSDVNITINPQGSSKINVLGQAHLDGNLTIQPETGFYGFSNCFTILSSLGRTGTFIPPLNVNGFTFTTQYIGNDVLLCFEASSPFSLIPIENSNIQAVVNNIDALIGSDELPLDLIQALNTLTNQSASIINNALDQMHPAQYSALIEWQNEINAHFIDFLHPHFYLPCSCIGKIHFWVAPFANNLSLKKDGMQVGSDGTSGGVAIGVNRRFNHQFSIGAAGIYNYGKINWQSTRGHGDVNEIFGALYSEYQYDQFKMEATFLFGACYFETLRHITFLTTNEHVKAHFTTTDVMGNLYMNYLFGASSLVLYPYANFDWLYDRTRSFQEENGGGFDLNVHRRTDNTLRSELGIGIQFQDKNSRGDICISPKISLGWVNVCPLQRDQYRSQFSGTNIPYSVKGWNKTWNLLNIDFGIKMSFGCMSLGGEYTVEMSPDSKTTLFNQSGNLVCDWKW